MRSDGTALERRLSYGSGPFDADPDVIIYWNNPRRRVNRSNIFKFFIKFIADRKFEMERMGQDPDAFKMVRIRMRKTVKISRSLMPSLSLAERD